MAVLATPTSSDSPPQGVAAMVVLVWLLVRCCRAGLPFVLEAGRTALRTQPRRRLHGNCAVSYLSLTLWLYTLLDASRGLMLVTLY
jgi:hypothetical protein